MSSKAAVLNYSEADVKRCSVEKLFWKFSETFKGNIRCRGPLLVKLKADCSEQLFHTKTTSPRVFSLRFSIQMFSELLDITDYKCKYFFVEKEAFLRCITNHSFHSVPDVVFDLNIFQEKSLYFLYILQS